MFTISENGRSLSGRVLTRRSFLQVGSLGGICLANLLRANASSAAAPDVRKSVVVLWLGGGPPQHETFDPKLDAPIEIRSIHGAVKTSVPGVFFGADFPEMAKRMNQLAVVRSYKSTTADHVLGHKIVLSGGSNAEAPSIGSVLSRLRGPTSPTTGMPSYALISDPKDTFNFNAVAKGADAGKWPKQFNPFQYIGEFPTNTPANLKSERPPLIEDMDIHLPLDRFENRVSLLQQIDHLSREVDRWSGLEHVDKYRLQAFDVLRKGIGQAFDISQEDPKLLARYDTSMIKVGFRTIGYHPSILGKQMLLARRMCEAGCGLVLVQSLGWDFHNNDATPGLVEGLAMHAPEVDKSVAAFLDDVRDRGLSDQILLVITGEMGRTPKITNAGRDHWANSTPLVLAGGGIRTGQVIGESDRIGGDSKSNPYLPSHLISTVLRALQVDPTALRLRPELPREVGKLLEPEPIRGLF